MAVPQVPNQRRIPDFVSDMLVDGRQFRILCVMDDYSRECLAVIVDNSLSSQRAARELDAIAEQWATAKGALRLADTKYLSLVLKGVRSKAQASKSASE